MTSTSFATELAGPLTLADWTSDLGKTPYFDDRDNLLGGRGGRAVTNTV